MITGSIDSNLNELNLVSRYQPNKKSEVETGLNKLLGSGARISGNLESADLSAKTSNKPRKSAPKISKATGTLCAVDNRLSDVMDLVISMRFLAQKGMTKSWVSHSDQIEFDSLKDRLLNETLGQPSQNSNINLNGTLDKSKLTSAGISRSDAATISSDYSISGLGLEQLDISNSSNAKVASQVLTSALDKIISGRLATRKYLIGEDQPDPKTALVRSISNLLRQMPGLVPAKNKPIGKAAQL
jgi:hypothetical protein